MKMDKKYKVILICIVCLALVGSIFFFMKKDSKVNRDLTTNIEDLSYPIFDEDGIQATLVYFKDAKTGALTYAVRVVNDTDDSFYNTVEYVIINKEQRIDCDTSIVVDAHSTKLTVIEDLAVGIKVAEIDRIETMDIYMGTWEDTNEYSVEIGEQLNPGIICDTYKDAKADEQVLVDNEEVKITLMGMGYYYSNEYTERLSGIVLFENKSDITIPVGVGNVRINGVEFETDGRVQKLEAGLSRYCKFSVRSNDNYEPESIYDISLLLTTSEKELTGTVNFEGGLWYDVILSQSGEVEEREIEGELIFDENDIQIYYTGQTGRAYTYSKPESGYFDWNFIIVNNSDQDVEIRGIDFKFDGKPIEEHMYFDNSDIGSGSQCFTKLYSKFVGMDAKRPVLSFTPQFRTRGGGSIIFTSKNETEIQPEGDAIDFFEQEVE